MTHASLFSGIGGFDLASEKAGMENIFAVEKDKFCQKVLKKNFPKLRIFGDIKEFDGRQYEGRIDIISGGFPCQPFSVAGKRKGAEDDRYLWPETLRVISEIKPSWVVGENVAGIINMALEKVLSDLEISGYETQTFIIPACAVNASHRRDRVWIIANSSSLGFNRRRTYRNCEVGKREIHENQQINRKEIRSEITCGDSCVYENATYSTSKGLERGNRNKSQYSEFTRFSGWPTQSPVCGRNDGVPNRVDRIRALGNAIVPQVVFQFFQAIMKIEAGEYHED